MSEQKNIPYRDSAAKDFHAQKHRLDMYWPAIKQNCPVLVFIHGGTWISGSKDMYTELGRNFAAKGIVTAVINYRLGDVARFDQMAEDCAAAVKWVHEHAGKYNGDPSSVAVSGHSAGGHLAALITLDPVYFRTLQSPNPIKSCLLIDAFGLNVDTFLQSPLVYMYRSYIDKVFTGDSVQWKKASPASHVHAGQVPFFVTTGNNSYPFLLRDNEVFVEKVRQVKATVVVEHIPGKNHAEMISQLRQKDHALYARMIRFMENAKRTD